MKILILGGYGRFGGRLAQLLCGEPSVTLLIAGRSREKAARFCEALPGAAPRRPVVFDRDGDVLEQLRALSPQLVVDASGPFQVYGDDPYRVVEAALACGIDYLDLADGSAFVKGIARFDDEAKTRGLFVLSGASSLPLLSAAVVRRLARGMTRLIAISGGIAPSPYAGIGRNVVRAIASYAGQRTTLWRDGAVASGYALIEALRFTIAPPGRMPLRNIRFTLVDAPDLQVLPEIWPDLQEVWIGAGPVPGSLHRLLSGLAWLVRLRVLPSLLPLAGLFHRAMNVVRWGEHRGGMFILVRGADGTGAAIERSWHLVAEADDGPFIPSMAVAALVLRVLNGQGPQPGARPAVNDLELEDYERLFAQRRIFTGMRSDESGPLYRRILGSAWDDLPPELRAMHEISGEKIVRGAARVERGTGVIARLVATLFRLPRAGENVPVTVTFTLRDGAEVWRRNFSGRSFVSVQREGQGRSARLIEERFGPVCVALAVVVENGVLRLIVRGWRLFGVPMPLWLAPHGAAREFVAEGRFNFDVEIRQRLIGRVVRYRGWLLAA